MVRVLKFVLINAEEGFDFAKLQIYINRVFMEGCVMGKILGLGIILFVLALYLIVGLGTF